MSREKIRSDDTSHAILMVGWKLLANLTKSTDFVFAYGPRLKNVFDESFPQDIGLRGLNASSFVSMSAIKGSSKATAILVPTVCRGSANSLIFAIKLE